MSHNKLYIPGPVEVNQKTWDAMTTPLIGHRSKDFQALYGEVQPMLQKVLYTERLVFISTSSAWGVMEGAVRNLVQKKVLNCMAGAFSDKWLDVSKRCGKEAEALRVDWGSPILPDMIDAKLATGEFDAITLVHNETSTGTMMPLEEIAALKSKYPEVSFIVDSVSSMTARKIEFDKLGIDLLLAGCQKALALPPGIAVFVCSQAALDKASNTHDRGYYFDICEFQNNAEKNMTPSTPSISHIYALRSKLTEILEEGLETRFARHLRLATRTREWAKNHGFTLFPEPGYESVSLTCINNGAKEGGRTIDVPALQKSMLAKGFVIDGGYGKIKGTTFRLSNMGDETDDSMSQLYSALDSSLENL